MGSGIETPVGLQEQSVQILHCASPHLCRRVASPAAQMRGCQGDEMCGLKPADEACLRVIHLTCMPKPLSECLSTPDNTPSCAAYGPARQGILPATYVLLAVEGMQRSHDLPRA